MTQSNAPWWQRGVIYQIYPRSFMDSSGDGIGDLRGIVERLDYLKWLGVDGLWLSPTFPSPMADFGYDVADYTDVHPLFGTLDDFDHLLAEAHRRDIRILLDLVPNHTSSQHRWFLESRSSRDNPKRDWYIWRDPVLATQAKPDGSPPNNWLAYFGGSAWTWDEATGQYYLHNFLPEQPDLNWHNPEVRQAMFDAIRFWLKRGVDGFRIDVIDRMLKDEQFRDNPLDPGWLEGRDNPAAQYLRLFSENRPGIHELIREFRAVFDEFPDRVSIGEIAYSLNPSIITAFYGEPTQPFGTELHLPFNFALTMLDWNAKDVRGFVDAYEGMIPAHGWANYVLGNHDQPRVATRIGVAPARAAAMLLLTLRGTPFLYYGDELGMRDVNIPAEQYQDPQGINIGISRDPERTPMQWSAAPNAGFAPPGVTPWLPLAPDYATVNVEAEQRDPRSMLMLCKRLIDLRRSDEALSLGNYQSLDAPDGVFAFARGGRYAIALNFTGDVQRVPLSGEIVLSTHLDRDGAVDNFELRPNEGVILSGDYS
ncbi:MAG: alpha-amylase [Anaerolineae bacterium]|nr:alpha-amylase [Anaerolineae bacterium]